MAEATADIGIIGMEVMGRNIALNFERNGYTVAVYNRTTSKMQDLVDENPGKNLVPTETYEEFVAALKKPRRALVMVKAGKPVDYVIDDLAPLYEQGDLIIDGGNSYFHDTERRANELEAKGLTFLGMGISGGEEGALWGPSLMPGGSREVWSAVDEMMQAVAAKAEEDGEPCVAYLGPRGAGHYVKMVHNGIEYADMQLIAEAYDILRHALDLSPSELADIFDEWNQGELDSFLIDITVEIFRRVDDETGKPLVDQIRDEAAQKGTGKWTSQDAFNVGAAIPTIDMAVVGRILSSFKDERVAASKVLPGPNAKFEGDRETLINQVRQALYASKISAYAQGMSLLKLASGEYDYDLNLGEVASIWRAGCIIRARFLDEITAAYDRDAKLVNLMLDGYFRDATVERLPAWRSVVQTAVGLGIPIPAFGASLAYYDSYRSERLPANLIQAQRDFFGAHTYERLDVEGVFHTEWAAEAEEIE